MATDKVISVKSTDEVAKRFDQLIEEEKITKGELLAQMIADRESKKMGIQMPERLGDIKAFEEATERIKTLYRSSLELAKDAHERAVKQVKAEIAVHLQTIADLQQERDALRAELDKSEKEYTEQVRETKKIVQEMTELQKKLQEKDKVIAEKDSALKSQADMIDMLKEMKELMIQKKSK